jgi:hypothetical protein
MNENTPNQRDPNTKSLERREFLKKAAGRSLAAAGIAAAATAVAYKTPRVRSFLPEVTVYAQATGAGKFSLHGTT